MLTIHSWYTGTCSSRYGTSTRRSPVSVRSVLISIAAQQPPAGWPVAGCYGPRHGLQPIDLCMVSLAQTHSAGRPRLKQLIDCDACACAPITYTLQAFGYEM